MNAVESIGHSIALPGQAPMDLRRLDFLRRLWQLPAVTEVSHLDGQGKEQLKISRLAIDTVGSGTDYAADPRFVEARKGRAWFGPVYFRKETEPYMTIAIPEARDSRGEPVLSGHATIDSIGWHVFVEEPRSAVFAPLNDSILRTALLLLAGAVISVVASLFLVRRKIEPIRALQKGAERIGAGNLDGRIEVGAGDELQRLAERFSTMASQLRESYAGLESKVEERTAELRETLKQQTATSDILRVISSSPTDARPVFEAIVKAAAGLGRAIGSTAFKGFHESVPAYSVLAVGEAQ